MPISQIISQLTKQTETARAANVARRQQVEAIMDEIIGRYGPEGAYGAGLEAQLGRQKVGAVGAGAQRLIGAGLYGTEVGAGLERAWEAEVGAPARARLEDIKMERLSEAQTRKAGFLERIEDVYPDYGLISQLLMQAANVPRAAAAAPTPTARMMGGITPTRTRQEEYGLGIHADLPGYYAGQVHSGGMPGGLDLGVTRPYGWDKPWPGATAKPTPTRGVVTPTRTEQALVEARLKKRYGTTTGLRKQPTGWGELFQRGMGRMP